MARQRNSPTTGRHPEEGRPLLGELSLEERLRRMAMEVLVPPHERAIDPQESERLEAGRRSLEAFTLYTKPDFVTNWHHKVLFDKVEALIRGDILRLMVFMPPQHGKTEIASRRFPAYLLGRQPDTRVIACSYNDTYAGLNNRDVQKVIDEDAYKRLFPGTLLFGQNVRTQARGHYLRNAEMFEVVNRKGSYRSAGIGVGIGGMPFNFGIIDDPIKDDKEANSPAIRESIWNWYVTVFSARKAKAGARILIIMTRWHQDDLAGRLLHLGGTNAKADQWEVVEFPAILEDETQRNKGDHRKLGEALWEEWHPEKELEVERIQAGPIKWSAVFQQRPSPARGTIFQREHFRYFWTEAGPDGKMVVLDPNGLHQEDSGTLEHPSPPTARTDLPLIRYPASACRFFQVCDPADTAKVTSAFTCVITVCKTPGNHLLFWHVWRQRLEFPQRYQAILGLRPGLGRWDDEQRYWVLPGLLNPWPSPLAYQAMENKASGIGMIQQAAADGCPFRVLKPGTASKIERCAQVSILYQNTQVYHHLSQPWLTAFESELLSFPTARFSDQVDCAAYAGILYSQDVLLGGGGATNIEEVRGTPEQQYYGNGYSNGQGSGEVLNVGGIEVLFPEDDDWFAR